MDCHDGEKKIDLLKKKLSIFYWIFSTQADTPPVYNFGGVGGGGGNAPCVQLTRYMTGIKG